MVRVEGENQRQKPPPPINKAKGNNPQKSSQGPSKSASTPSSARSSPSTSPSSTFHVHVSSYPRTVIKKTKDKDGKDKFVGTFVPAGPLPQISQNEATRQSGSEMAVQEKVVENQQSRKNEAARLTDSELAIQARLVEDELLSQVPNEDVPTANNTTSPLIPSIFPIAPLSDHSDIQTSSSSSSASTTPVSANNCLHQSHSTTSTTTPSAASSSSSIKVSASSFSSSSPTPPSPSYSDAARIPSCSSPTSASQAPSSPVPSSSTSQTLLSVDPQLTNRPNPPYLVDPKFQPKLQKNRTQNSDLQNNRTAGLQRTHVPKNTELRETLKPVSDSLSFFGLPKKKAAETLAKLFGENLTIITPWTVAKNEKRVTIQACSREQHARLCSAAEITAHSPFQLKSTRDDIPIWGVAQVTEDRQKIPENLTVNEARDEQDNIISDHQGKFKKMLKMKVKGNWVNTKKGIFTFGCKHLPKKIKIGENLYDVIPYAFPAQHCHRCCSYDHSTHACEKHDISQPRCAWCAESHHYKDCPVIGDYRRARCVHCRGNHPVWDQGCEYRRVERDTNTMRAGTRLTRAEAGRMIAQGCLAKAEGINNRLSEQGLVAGTRPPMTQPIDSHTNSASSSLPPSSSSDTFPTTLMDQANNTSPDNTKALCLLLATLQHSCPNMDFVTVIDQFCRFIGISGDVYAKVVSDLTLPSPSPAQG